MDDRKDKPFIVGVIGHAKSGKDTYVDAILRSNLLEACHAENYGSIALAAGLKRMAEILGFTKDDCYDQNRKEVVNLIFGITPRKAMQDIGTIFREKFGKDIWLKSFELRVVNSFTPDSLIFVPDIRFPNEASYFRERFHCVMVKIIRPSLDLSLPMYQHESETLVDTIPIEENDIIITNDGSLEEFKLKCVRNFNPIINGYRKHEVSADPFIN